MPRRWQSTASARSTWSSSISIPSRRLCAGAERDEIIENIDIGGPSMVRSAAKNHAYRRDRHRSRRLCRAACRDRCERRRDVARLPQAAGGQGLRATAAYDSMISQWFAFADQRQRWPASWRCSQPAEVPLRYGENPHQQAALYVPAGPHRRGSPRPSRSRARSSATTISTMPMPRSSWSPNFATARRRW